MAMKLVLASNNAGKLAELQQLFAELAVTLVPQSALGVGEAEEPFRTFVENALAKARHASAATGLPAIADDAGLCVDAFGGLPGVDTAFYATQFGYAKGDANNVKALLEQLDGADTTIPSRSSRSAAWSAKSRTRPSATTASASIPSCTCPTSARPLPSCRPR
jgi:non-canonical purine NTP pyrophosphatase (RdgB/HAM1 family)